jgi:regulatory protein
MLEPRELKHKALGWLTRRDYSEVELRRRLQQLGGLSEHIEQVIAWCKDYDYLNQQRYINMLVRSRTNRGYGFNYIAQECKQHNISQEELQLCLAELNIDWFALAKRVYIKKYADNTVIDYKDKMKRRAYMQRRGFNNDQIQHVFTE